MVPPARLYAPLVALAASVAAASSFVPCRSFPQPRAQIPTAGAPPSYLGIGGEGEAAQKEFYTQGSRPYIPFERPELGADAAATVVTVSAASPEAAGDAAGHGYGCDHREPFASLGLASQSHAEPEDRTDLVKRWVRARMG